MIRAAELRDLCLAFAGSVETFPFGPKTSVFKIAGKMFALSQLAEHPLRVSLKCEPQLAEQTAYDTPDSTTLCSALLVANRGTPTPVSTW
jgi:predicted DNA-binding protein (MmcQ/YjbR family)